MTGVRLICSRESAGRTERHVIAATGWSIWDLLAAGTAWEDLGYDVRVEGWK